LLSNQTSTTTMLQHSSNNTAIQSQQFCNPTITMLQSTLNYYILHNHVALMPQNDANLPQTVLQFCYNYAANPSTMPQSCHGNAAIQPQQCCNSSVTQSRHNNYCNPATAMLQFCHSNAATSVRQPHDAYTANIQHFFATIIYVILELRSYSGPTKQRFYPFTWLFREWWWQCSGAGLLAGQPYTVMELGQLGSGGRISPTLLLSWTVAGLVTEATLNCYTVELDRELVAETTLHCYGAGLMEESVTEGRRKPTLLWSWVN
jgi:hypothetical protein